jgi:hypothetical protein
MTYQPSSQDVLSHEYHKGSMVGIVVKGVASSDALHGEARRLVDNLSVTRLSAPENPSIRFRKLLAQSVGQ